MATIDTSSIFSIATETQFVEQALQTFRYQYQNNNVYQRFCNLLKTDVASVDSIAQIPFLPIEFFKNSTILSGAGIPEQTFSSSGTTGSLTSKHAVLDVSLYEHSFRKGFELFYGSVANFCILALLPSYLERSGSSLIYMVDDMIKTSKHPKSGFYLNNLDELALTLQQLEANNTKTMLIGVSFALLDLAEQYNLNLQNTIVMETGGMKGRRKEMIRQELHHTLLQGLHTSHIHSEYGMTELLSQAYSKGKGLFNCPPWMRVLTRDTEDPLSVQPHGKTGGINVIDLANVHSCAFIATQDLGKVYEDKSFEVLGRFDHSDIRGCNLMVL
ncbi:acyl transferase [Flavobacterium sp. ASW18X]|uniref:LuxE/PaaK family acyltransferase n=1 Tax=Flavobacterium sp. ASW18X TaxID=2572595 RepID=UPI0010ADA72F|nr:acyl transferase [Flavobacterium sp. ASW18X]TKD65413.1 acyl transferase [Flavobacterium sp. ASW18X]